MSFSMDERKKAYSTKKKTDDLLDPPSLEINKKKQKRTWKKPKGKYNSSPNFQYDSSVEKCRRPLRGMFKIN